MATRTSRTVLITVSSGTFAFALGGITAPAAGQDPPFRITDLGLITAEPPLHSKSMALGINALGEVVGWSGRGDEEPYAFIWLPEANYGLSAGPLHSLTQLDQGLNECISEAHDINDRGEIAGQLGRTIFSPTARFWRYDAGWSSLDLSDPGLDSRAFALSNHDDPFVVGWHDATEQQQQQEYICDLKDDPVPLKFAYAAKITGASFQRTDMNADPPDNRNTMAYDVDDWPEYPHIVGVMDNCGGTGWPCPAERLAVYWWAGQQRFLDSLDPSPETDYRAEARGISQVGVTIEIAGAAWDWEYPDACFPHAAYWLGADGTCVELPDPPGGYTTSTGQAICRDDNVVRIAGWEGKPADPPYKCDAVLWEKEDGGNWQAIVLDTAIPTCSDDDWNLYQAQDVNADGWIVGVGRSLVPQEIHAFLLTPVRSEEECPWDLDRDGDVDTADLLELLASWGECRVGKICWTDFDTDCDTDTADHLDLLAHWGPCDGDGASQVPEEVLAAWLAGGGEEALLSNDITAEQVGACLDKSSPAEAIAALYELLFN